MRSARSLTTCGKRVVAPTSTPQHAAFSSRSSVQPQGSGNLCSRSLAIRANNSTRRTSSSSISNGRGKTLNPPPTPATSTTRTTRADKAPVLVPAQTVPITKETFPSPPFNFSPLPFSTSITNTGVPFGSFDDLSPSGQVIIPSDTAAPGSAPPGFIIPDSYDDYPDRYANIPAFSTSIANTGVPIWVIDENWAYPAVDGGSRPAEVPRMSDQDYATFLEKASGDVSGSAQTSAPSSAKKGREFTTESVTAEVPATLKGVKATYSSESDEPFEVVSLKLTEIDGSVIDSEQFKAVTGHEAVEEIPAEEFDPRNEYQQILSKVKEAGNGECQVFRVELGRARVEYWVVSVDEESSKLVGLRAGSVES